MFSPFAFRQKSDSIEALELITPTHLCFYQMYHSVFWNNPMISSLLCIHFFYKSIFRLQGEVKVRHRNSTAPTVSYSQMKDGK